MTNIADVVIAYERAKEKLSLAKIAVIKAVDDEKKAATEERAAYKAFNEAVAAIKPKRGPRGEGGTEKKSKQKVED